MNPTRLSQLIDAYLDGALTPEETAELSGTLLRSGEARKQFWSQAAIHGVLPEAVQTQWLAQAEPGASSKVIQMPTPHQKILRFVRLAAAACLLFSTVWWGMRQDWWPIHGPSVAQLERAPGAVWEGRHSPERGSALSKGRYRLTAGAVELRMQSGARLIVEAPADFELINRNQARLLSGQCSGFVPPEAVGFRIDAPSFTLTDLGTAFGLKVPPSGPSEAHVFEGEVEVAAEHVAPVRLVQGEAVQLDAGVFASIAARPADFLSAERLAARDSEKARHRIDQWRDLATRLSNDPATLVHFTCEDQDRWDTALRNAAQSPDADRRTAMIMGADWSEGRWPGKKAIVFREPGDRVRFEVPGHPTELTLLACICVDARPNEFNALLMTENLTLGDLRWELLKDGRLELCVRTGRVADGEKFERVTTKPIIDDTMLGRWVTIVTTYNGATGEIAHYLEGELVTRERTERTTPTALGSLELGNWGIQLDDPKWTWTKASGPAFYQRNFTGRIDQFAMLSRVLSPEEVRTYSLGR